MSLEAILAVIEGILQQREIIWKTVDLESSKVLGINDAICFNVTDGGFMAVINPAERPILEQREEASMVAYDFTPADDQLFICISNQDDQAVILFWVNKTLEYLQTKQTPSAK